MQYISDYDIAIAHNRWEQARARCTMESMASDPIPVPFDQILNSHLVKSNCNQKYGIIRSQRLGEREAGGKLNLIYCPHLLNASICRSLQLSTSSSFSFKTYKK